MSSIDLLLTLIEQSEADEKKALQYMEFLGSPKGLYETMIQIVKEQRSDDDRKSIERIYSWCTYAKQPLSVEQLEHIGTLDACLGKFDVGKEIQGKSSRYASLRGIFCSSSDVTSESSAPDG
jgi:hypothetical protein